MDRERFLDWEQANPEICAQIEDLLQDEEALKSVMSVLPSEPDEPASQEVVDTIREYKRFHDHNRKLEEKETTDKLSLLMLRRWHYDHPQEYADFISQFKDAYNGDMAFIQSNFFCLVEMLSFKGVKEMIDIVSSLFPGNPHFMKRLASADDNPLQKRLQEVLNSCLDNDAVRTRLLRKNPYLLSFFYWIVFDNGFLRAADLISHSFLKEDSPAWGKSIGQKVVQALISASIGKANYSKSQWKEISKMLKKGEAKKVINAALLEEQGRRGRRKKILLLEEMLPAKHVPILIEELSKILSEHKEYNGPDTILAYIFHALVQARLTNDDYNYRTFHAAMREKFPGLPFSEGYDWSEALYCAIASNDADGNTSISERQIELGRKYANIIKLRLLLAINPSIA